MIGIPTLAAVSPGVGGLAPGIGFAISTNRVKIIADQIVRDGKVTNSGRAYLGMEAADTTAGAIQVAAVVARGPAASAGISAGDLIKAVAHQPTPTSAQLAQVLATLKPNQVVPVDLVSAVDGDQRTVSVTLGEYPGG